MSLMLSTAFAAEDGEHHDHAGGIELHYEAL
jgi:hypothetical protein